MTIPTQMSLHGFIATAPELTYGKSDVARFRARVGIEQWRKEADGAFTKLDPQFCDMVLFKSSAERAYARFRAGDQLGLLHDRVTVVSHAAGVAGVVMIVSISMGVKRPSAVCRRRRW